MGNYVSLMVLDALDNFSTTDMNELRCVARFIGELVGEDEDYYFLRHIKADLLMDKSAEEIHKVLKHNIVRKGFVELTLEE